MLELFLFIICVVFIVILVYASTKPDAFRVERSISIAASADTVFAVINDFHNWDAWSPWNKYDPAMKKTISGSMRGAGAVYEWDGNKKAGTGRNEILESIQPNKILMQLDMFKPFKAHNIVEFSLQTQGESTLVTWVMHGSQPYMVKLIGVFINCDNMAGKDFEEGLVNLKRLTER